MRRLLATLVLGAALTLGGCGKPTKQELTQKAAGVSTKDELTKRLGKPDKYFKLGPVETWTYQAKDGTLSFVVTGDKVVVDFTADKVDVKTK
jgi:hypothetical protein